MDATAPELASGDITHFPFFAFQTQRKGSSRMWARVYKRLILRRPCTHPKTTLRSICKSKKKKLYLLWFKRNRNQTEFKLHSQRKGLTIHTHLPVYSYLLLPGRSQWNIRKIRTPFSGSEAVLLSSLYTSWKEDCTSKGWYVSNVSRLSVPFAALPALPHHPDLRTYVLYLSC